MVVVPRLSATDLELRCRQRNSYRMSYKALKNSAIFFIWVIYRTYESLYPSPSYSCFLVLDWQELSGASDSELCERQAG